MPRGACNGRVEGAREIENAGGCFGGHSLTVVVMIPKGEPNLLV